MNYDFKANWKTEIMPLLDNEELQKAIKKGIQTYLQNEREICKINGNDIKNIRKYNKKTPPCWYGKYEGIDEMDFEEELEMELLEKGILKEDKLKPKKENYKDEDEYEDMLNEYYDNFDYMSKYEKYKRRIIKPFVEEWRKTNYITYCLYGGCFWWNKTFTLTLAKLLMPNEKWRIVSNDIHLTITNEERSKVFDILLYDEHDKITFGGKTALENATYQGTRKEWYMKNHDWNEEEYNKYHNY